MRKQLLALMLGAVTGAFAPAAAGASSLMATTALSSSQTYVAPPATAFARRPAISSVSLSSDGAHIAAVISPNGQDRAVAIWDVSDIRKAPYVIGTDPKSEIVSVSFIKNDRLFVRTQQMTDFTLGGDAERSFMTRTQILDLQGNPVRINLQFDGLTPEQQQFIGVGGLISDLPRDERNILVSDPLRGDIYIVDTYSGRAERRERGSDKFVSRAADLNGDIRARTEYDFDSGAFYSAQWIKGPDGQWVEQLKSYAADRHTLALTAFTNDPNVVLVESSRALDTSAIYDYNLSERALGEVAFHHPAFEVGGAIRSKSANDFGEIIGFSYQGPRPAYVWLDPTLKAAQDQLRDIFKVELSKKEWVTASGERHNVEFPEAADISFTAISDDRKVFVVRKSGPGSPPEYYLLKDGKLTLLGRAYPELKTATFGPQTVIQYRARDGLMIPAILTKPDPAIFGPGPYPAIITPHGGPWSRDTNDWDPTGWTQYFATRGYAVLQPQFRGSAGWGQALWRAGDAEWGRKMQDDKDDGARYLIAEGVAAPDRIAMHGYSYGGYASMMAAVRPNGLYQCVAAGAGPATIDLFKKGTFANRFLREFQHPTAAGEDPLRRVAEVSIPVYLYSGDRDTVVIPSESRTFAAALQRLGRPYKLNILPNMEHTMNTWTPANTAAILTTVEDFFKNDCGSGGL